MRTYANTMPHKNEIYNSQACTTTWILNTFVDVFKNWHHQLQIVISMALGKTAVTPTELLQSCTKPSICCFPICKDCLLTLSSPTIFSHEPELLSSEYTALCHWLVHNYGSPWPVTAMQEMTNNHQWYRNIWFIGRFFFCSISCQSSKIFRKWFPNAELNIYHYLSAPSEWKKSFEKFQILEVGQVWKTTSSLARDICFDKHNFISGWWNISEAIKMLYRLSIKLTPCNVLMSCTSHFQNVHFRKELKCAAATQQHISSVCVTRHRGILCDLWTCKVNPQTMCVPNLGTIHQVCFELSHSHHLYQKESRWKHIKFCENFKALNFNKNKTYFEQSTVFNGFAIKNVIREEDFKNYKNHHLLMLHDLDLWTGFDPWKYRDIIITNACAKFEKSPSCTFWVTAFKPFIWQLALIWNQNISPPWFW